MLAGIIGIEYQLCSRYVDQKELAGYLGIEEGKLLKGLGLLEMAVPADDEDVISLAMSAVYRLMKKYKIKAEDVGRLEVGTESNFDGSKSLKTFLIDLFGEQTCIGGADTTNACYGGTNALLNAIAWAESSLWDGKYAIVVMTDISLYKEESAIPTCGGGAVAILVGRNPVFTIQKNTLVHHNKNVLDFFKPKDAFPYPILNGKLSVECYFEGFSKCYERLKERLGENIEFDYLCCHAPYSRMSEKIAIKNGIPIEKTTNGLFVSRRNGNSYTASLYFCLLSFINKNINVGEKILMYSYGSGYIASMFILKKVKEGCDVDDCDARLNSRVKISPEEYFKTFARAPVNLKNKSVVMGERVFTGYYLKSIEEYKREYEFYNKEK